MARPIRRRIGKSPSPWYLNGGISKANCVAVYQPKGAASYAASKVNLVTPGTYDLSDGAAFPTWAFATGWTFNGATQYLTVASALVSAVPLSLVCRFNAVGVALGYALITICDFDSLHWFLLYAGGDAVGDPVQASTWQDANKLAASTSGFTAGNWFTAAGVYSAVDARAAYIDGGSKGTNVDSQTPVGLDTTIIGGFAVTSAVGGILDGSIAACAIYNIALSDAQVLALHTAMAAL